MFPVRILIFILILITIIITVNCMFIYYLNNSSAKLQTLVVDIKTIILTNNISSISKNMLELNNSWKKTLPVWSLIIDHPEIDTIQISLSRMESFINTHNYSSAIAENDTIRGLLSHIAEKEKFSWKNIL